MLIVDHHYQGEIDEKHESFDFQSSLFPYEVMPNDSSLSKNPRLRSDSIRKPKR